MAADAGECFRFEQDATACGTCCFIGGISDPRRRIELQEEIDEGGDECAFGEVLGGEAHHVRGKIEMIGFGFGDEFGDAVGMVADIGVGEEEIVGLMFEGFLRALVNGPEFAGPAGW